MGGLVMDEPAQVRAAVAAGNPDQLGGLHPVAAGRLGDLEAWIRIRSHERAHPAEGVLRVGQDGRSGITRLRVHANQRVANLAAVNLVVRTRRKVEVADVARFKGLAEAARGHTHPGRGDDHAPIRGDPDADQGARRRDERVSVIGPVERASQADPGQPAGGLDDTVHPREEPVGAGQRAPKGCPDGNPDGRRSAVGQDAAEGDDHGLVVDRRCDGSAVDRQRRDPEGADPGGDGIELDAVDRTAARVA